MLHTGLFGGSGGYRDHDYGVGGAAGEPKGVTRV
ncbi:Plasma membrane associated protein [Zea mays]|nr:Plasma membrane associated protein [Zea mays]